MAARGTVLITGTSSGFGKQLVTAFLERGWTVLASLRNAESRRDLFRDQLVKWPEALQLVDLDVTDADARGRAARLIEERFEGRLDCLVNNAGYGLFGALEDLGEGQFRDVMEVNFFGLAFTTRAMLPFLRNARGRIINISSVVGYYATPLSSAYCSSKFAVEGLSESLYYELKPHGVQVALVEPGSYRTGFREGSIWGERSGDVRSPYQPETESYRRYREDPSRPRNADSGEVIGSVMELSEKKKMPLRVRCGKDARAGWLAKKLLPESVFFRLSERALRRSLFRQGR